MSKLINRHGISEELFNVLSIDNYDSGGADISVTSLIAPPRIVALKERHGHEIEVDVSDRIYAIMGRIKHEILHKMKLQLAGDNTELRAKNIADTLREFNEGQFQMESLPQKLKEAVENADTQSCKENHGVLLEQRFFYEYSGWKLSGQVDHIKIFKFLKDYKLCSRWSALDESGKKEWIQQLNCYDYLSYVNGIEVEELFIEAIYRDWSKIEASRNENYPQAQSARIPIERWSREKQGDFIHERIRIHQAARKFDDQTLPMCSAEERWAVEPSFAITKEGRKRAIRLMPSRAEARGWIERNAKPGEKLIIEPRDGESKRCIHYCEVAEHCEFGRHLKSRKD